MLLTSPLISIPMSNHVTNPISVPRTRAGSDRHGCCFAGLKVSATAPGIIPSRTQIVGAQIMLNNNRFAKSLHVEL